MTVAIGLVCSDGVIVASDSMGSSGNVAGRSQKVKVLSERDALRGPVPRESEAIDELPGMPDLEE